MKIIAVIPARFGSTRFPGKPLVELKGKKIIQWVVEGARTSSLVQAVYVATDDQRIADFCKSIGVEVLMTRSDCPTGTDRIYEATKNLDFDCVLNIQGDEPLITKDYIDPLAQAFLNDAKLEMATLAHPLHAEDLDNLNAVKVITNINQEAIYFSRFPIPFSREKFQGNDGLTLNQLPVMKHIGLYGYSKQFLQKFCTTDQTALEKKESLEQLRALYLGVRIKVLPVEKPTYGVDTPEDLQKLEALL
ncbi:MAG: 3-deoxy-manno-octulosonate cytidylyltransferase [Bdellovibrio sp.]|nr:3-deoxy-manno-octulosonate cytidylyltransferase [Bdellovibrio sp.]